LIYVIVAGGWILFSDKLLGLFVTDENELVKFSIVKGLGFVVVTGCLLHQMLRHWLKRWEREAEQRERAEAALRRNELLQRTILDNIPDPVWMKDLDGRFVEVNHAWCQFAGLTRENSIGRTSADLFPAEAAARFQEQDLAVLQTGRPLRYEESVANGRGGTRAFETFKSAVNDSAGQPMGTIGIARDITRRKRATDRDGSDRCAPARAPASRPEDRRHRRRTGGYW
jgi:PAS domain S-box-containing protein